MTPEKSSIQKARGITSFAAGCLLLLACSAAPISAKTPPPALPSWRVMPYRATLRSEPAAGFTLGAFDTRFEHTTLNDVRGALHAGQIERQGDAGGSILWLCYTNTHAMPVERIWIVSSGEMGGPDHAVQEIDIENAPSSGPSHDCPSLPKAMTPVIVGAGLEIGSPISSVVLHLGQPSVAWQHWLSFDYEHTSRENCATWKDSEVDFTNWLMLRSLHGRVQSLHAGQVTSC